MDEKLKNKTGWEEQPDLLMHKALTMPDHVKNLLKVEAEPLFLPYASSQHVIQEHVVYQDIIAGVLDFVANTALLAIDMVLRSLCQARLGARSYTGQSMQQGLEAGHLLDDLEVTERRPATPSQHASSTSAESSLELSQRPPSADASDSSSSSTTSSRYEHSDTTSRYERMILNSTPYLCSLPNPPPLETKNTTASTRAAEEEAAELARATDRGYDLLEPMSNSCLYFISGWWSYQFCYAHSVKQFHQLPPGKNVPVVPPVEDPTTPSYILGRFGEKRVNRHRLPAGGVGGALDGGLSAEEGEGEGSTTTIQAKGSASSRYLSQKLSGGTTCDLTGAPRRVEIQFHCHPQSADRIGWIKEVSTCSYLMVVYTPRLCNDVAFLPERQERAEEIVCREVVKEEEVARWKNRKSQEGEKLLIGQVANTVTGGATGKAMVGDIEVGAMKTVGGDKGWLEPPALGRHGHGLNFGKDGTILPKGQTIAHQHTKEEGGAVHRVSDKEMKDLGVDVKSANAVIKELQELAMGKGWRLEVFHTEGRVEMRAIVEESEDPEGHSFEGVDIIIAEGGDDDDEEEGSQEEYRDEL
ncbi:MAG: hypothetical protein Q9217_001694 [Psora testacea]